MVNGPMVLVSPLSIKFVGPLPNGIFIPYKSRQITRIPKTELRGVLGDSLTFAPPFGVMNRQDFGRLEFAQIFMAVNYELLT